jgi:hypothetical protein
MRVVHGFALASGPDELRQLGAMRVMVALQDVIDETPSLLGNRSPSPVSSVVCRAAASANDRSPPPQKSTPKRRNTPVGPAGSATAMSPDRSRPRANPRLNCRLRAHSMQATRRIKNTMRLTDFTDDGLRALLRPARA